MRNFFERSLRICNYLLRTNILNSTNRNYDLKLTKLIDQQFTKNFSSVKNTSTELPTLKRELSVSPDKHKDDLNKENDNDLNLKHIHKHLKKDREYDFQFKTTIISSTVLPEIDAGNYTKKFGKELTEGSLSNLKMSLEGAGKPKWHLKNVFYLLKKNEEEDDEKKFKNLNKFNVTTDFRKAEDLWICSTTLYHPTRQTFESSSRRKIDAEDSAAYQAMLWLREQGYFHSYFYYFKISNQLSFI